MSHQTSDLAHPQGFASIRWSLVLAAGRGDAPEADAALAEIAQTVTAPEDVDEELRHLFEAIRSRPY